MKFFVIVPIHVTNIEGARSIQPSQVPHVKAAVVEAVVNALGQVQDNGFDHRLNETTSIQVDFDNVRLQPD